MSPFIPLEHSGCVKSLLLIQRSGMHLHENVVCLHFAPGNLQGLQSTRRNGKGIQSDSASDSIAGSSQGSGLNLWKRRSYGLSQIHFGHSFVGKQPVSAVEG